MPVFRSLLVLAVCAAALASSVRGEEPGEGEAPAWAKGSLPAWAGPYQGKRGLGEPWSSRTKPLGAAVAGLDRWQANHFIVYRAETADFLDNKYTPLKVEYTPGLLPRHEKVVAQYTTPQQSARQKAVALATKALPAVFLHPAIPPLGKPVRADRNLPDEELLASGSGFCNEQARVLVRLCQAAGIPARLIFLFYADNRSGHVVAEFFADGRWSMADNSWYCVFPDDSGTLLSAAELHRSAESKQIADRAYRARFEEIIKLSDAQLGGDPEKIRKSLAGKTPDPLGSFGVLNYPLPN